jgi:hypothetical protein
LFAYLFDADRHYASTKQVREVNTFVGVTSFILGTMSMKK